MTAGVFTLVLLLGNMLRDILPLMISQKASFGALLEAFGLQTSRLSVDGSLRTGGGGATEATGIGWD